jgi:hypothetical protein
MFCWVFVAWLLDSRWNVRWIVDTCPLEFHWTLVGFARDIHWIWVTCSLHVCWNLRRSFAAWSLRFRWIFVTFPSDFRWRLAGCSLDLCGVAADCMLCRMPVGCSLDLCLIFTWASRGCSLNLCKVLKEASAPPRSSRKSNKQISTIYRISVEHISNIRRAYSVLQHHW